MIDKESSQVWTTRGFDALHEWVTQKREYRKEYSHRCLLKALDCDPTNSNAWYALSQFYHFAGRPGLSKKCQEINTDLRQKYSVQDFQAAVREIKATEKLSESAPVVQQFIFFWVDRVPGDAQEIVGQVLLLHPELEFPSSRAIHEVLSLEQLMEPANRLATVVGVNLALKNPGLARDKEALANAMVGHGINIAAIQLVENRMKQMYGFTLAENPNSLVCEQIRSVFNNGGYVVLVLNRQVDTSEYWFNTDTKMGALLKEAMETKAPPVSGSLTERPQTEKKKWQFWRK